MSRAPFFLVFAALFGCALAEVDPGEGGAELKVLVEPATNGWRVHVNRPASVALIEIVPNRGVGLLFPDPSRQSGEVEAGNTRLVTETGGLIKHHRAAYRDLNTFGIALSGVTAERSDRLVLAVACECTLNLESIALPGGPTEMFGSDPGGSAQAIALEVLEEVIPDGSEEDYAVARYFSGRNYGKG